MVGFEPTPSERNWFLVNRLNRSATSADVCVPPDFKHIEVRKNSLWSNLIMPLIPKWRDPLDAPGQPNRGGNFRLFSSQVIFNEVKQIWLKCTKSWKLGAVKQLKNCRKLYENVIHYFASQCGQCRTFLTKEAAILNLRKYFQERIKTFKHSPTFIHEK